MWCSDPKCSGDRPNACSHGGMVSVSEVLALLRWAKTCLCSALAGWWEVLSFERFSLTCGSCNVHFVVVVVTRGADTEREKPSLSSELAFDFNESLETVFFGRPLKRARRSGFTSSLPPPRADG